VAFDLLVETDDRLLREDGYGLLLEDATLEPPSRYPVSGSWVEAADDAQLACRPGLLTVTLAEALPAGTRLKAKLVSATGDTGWVEMTGAGITYVYDFDAPMKRWGVWGGSYSAATFARGRRR